HAADEGRGQVPHCAVPGGRAGQGVAGVLCDQPVQLRGADRHWRHRPDAVHHGGHLPVLPVVAARAAPAAQQGAAAVVQRGCAVERQEAADGRRQGQRRQGRGGRAVHDYAGDVLLGGRRLDPRHVRLAVRHRVQRRAQAAVHHRGRHHQGLGQRPHHAGHLHRPDRAGRGVYGPAAVLVPGGCGGVQAAQHGQGVLWALPRGQPPHAGDGRDQVRHARRAGRAQARQPRQARLADDPDELLLARALQRPHDDAGLRPVPQGAPPDGRHARHFRDRADGRRRHKGLPGRAAAAGQLHEQRPDDHGSVRRDQDRQQARLVGDGHPGLRVLHLAPPEQGLRVSVWRCHVPARLLLHVPPQGAQGRRLGADPDQAGDLPGVLAERGRDAAREEPAAARRGPLPDDADAAQLPVAQDDVYAAGDLQDAGAGRVQGAALAAPPLDQLDRAQPAGAGAGAQPVRHVLPVDA
ncbi:hypothetical protein IWQ56_006048, partial [Coemansia nantahalensis]